jgi:hypothetical protein
MVQNLGIAIGTAVAAMLLQERLSPAHPHMSGFRDAWLVAAAVVLASLLACAAGWLL